MTARRDLLEQENTAWNELCDRFKRLGEHDWERRGATGEWTPKDVLAHIASWHAYAVDRCEEFRATGRFTRLGREVDEYNEELYQRNRDLTLVDARTIFDASRHRFREELALVADPVPDPLAQMIAANGHLHYEEHIPLLDAFMESA